MEDAEAASILNKSLEELLKNTIAVTFVRSLIRDSYQSYFTGHEQEIGVMVDTAWDLLVSDEADMGSLERRVPRINREIFRKEDPEFWFNVLYKEYKTTVKPQKNFTELRPFISGNKVLDCGSGGGYLALHMAQNGFEVATTDVIDYRINEAKQLPFKEMISPTDIPYADDSFDTTMLKAVLHHINAADLSAVLQELHRVSGRLIIEEDTYDLPGDTPGIRQLLEAQPKLAQFTTLNPQDQLQVLLLIDYFSNAIAQGVTEMNFPFQFKTIPQWSAVLAKHNFRLTQVKLLGFQAGNVSQTCHVWLIADRSTQTI